ncbi:MAG TPA: restriction endonuclease [Rhodoferax sp.]
MNNVAVDLGMKKSSLGPQKKKTKQSEFVRWFAPLVQALKDLGGSAAPREALERIAEIEKVPEELRNEVLSSGQERFYNQVHWARQYLVWAGLIDSGRRGVWTLTPAGRQTTLTANSAREIFLEQVRQRAKLRKPSNEAARELIAQDDEQPPDTPQADEDASLVSFLQVVKSLSPSGFERLSMRLLREAGFERVAVTGRSNDGGIDGVGVLQLNDLVSFKVVFQCKKWENAVPPKEIRDLRGAMQGRAEKGIFLTTSTFTSNARSEAERAGAVPIELVDGEKLFEMFKRYELGLKPRMVFDIDLSFFEQFE